MGCDGVEGRFLDGPGDEVGELVEEGGVAGGGALLPEGLGPHPDQSFGGSLHSK